MVPRTCTFTAIAATALGGIGLPSNGWAQPITRHEVDLVYDVDSTLPNCPTEEEFRSIISAELGYDPHQANASTRITVRVRPTATGLAGELDSTTITDGRLGERRFTERPGECRRMVANLGFAVAVQLQLTTEQKARATASSKDRDSGANVGSSLVEKPEALNGAQAKVRLSSLHFEVRAPQRLEGKRWIPSLGLGPTVGFGVGPQTIGAGRLFGAVRHGWFGLELGAEASLPSTMRESYGGGFRYQVSLGTLAACVWYGPLSACGLGKVGQLRVHGVGVDVANRANGLIAAVGPRVSCAFDLTHSLFVQGHVETLISSKAWTVYVNHVAVWTAPRLAVVAGLDLGARFR